MIKYINIASTLLIIIMLMGCERSNCNKSDTVTDYKFNTSTLAFYNYNLNDIINCKINNDVLVSARITDTSSGIISTKENMDLNCGTGDILNFQYKESVFFDNRNELFLFARIKTDKRNEVEIKYDFYHDNLSNSSYIKIDINEQADTLTLNNKFYSDIYLKGDILGNSVYYSKSKGILKIQKNNVVKFSLL